MPNLHPNIFTATEADTRRWAVLHKSESFGGSVAGGIFRRGSVRGLRTRQVRSLVAAMGSSLIGACSEDGEEVRGDLACDDGRWSDFVAFARGFEAPEDAPGTDPSPEPLTLPTLDDAPVSAPSRDEEEGSEADVSPPEFEAAVEGDFEIESVTVSTLEGMKKADLEEWARARGVEAPASEFTKAEQIKLIRAAAGTTYEVEG